jgi:hypothetical protein
LLLARGGGSIPRSNAFFRERAIPFSLSLCATTDRIVAALVNLDRCIENVFASLDHLIAKK